MSVALRTRTARDPFAQLFGEFLAPRQATSFSPTFEVKETADSIVIRADVPGVAEADLEVKVHNNVLTISGSRKAEERKEGEAYSLYERHFGQFERTFSLADTVDGDKVEARLDAGVLTLTLGKRAEAKPRKIAITK